MAKTQQFQHAWTYINHFITCCPLTLRHTKQNFQVRIMIPQEPTRHDKFSSFWNDPNASHRELTGFP